MIFTSSFRAVHAQEKVRAVGMATIYDNAVDLAKK